MEIWKNRNDGNSEYWKLRKMELRKSGNLEKSKLKMAKNENQDK